MSMFSWVPGLNGKYVNYHGYFALIASAVGIILGFVCLLISYILRTMSNLHVYDEVKQEVPKTE